MVKITIAKVKGRINSKSVLSSVCCLLHITIEQGGVEPGTFRCCVLSLIFVFYAWF